MSEFIEDGVVIQGREMNADEIAEREQWAVDAIAAQLAAEEVIAAKESAHRKLIDLGLTAEEVSSLIGTL